MRSKIIILFCIITLALLLSNGCSTAEDAQYTLTVTVATGVTGTPAAGVSTYTENEVVNYTYSLQTGYENLVVTLDGVVVGQSGVIAMNTNHTLTVTAEEVFDVTGEWNGTWYYGYIDSNMVCTFTGGLYSGTLTGDIDYMGSIATGPYTISNSNIEFELNYGGGTLFFTGTIDDHNHMSGTWVAQPGGVNGTWDLER